MNTFLRAVKQRDVEAVSHLLQVTLADPIDPLDAPEWTLDTKHKKSLSVQDINSRDQAGRSCLHIAIMQHHHDMLDVLLTHPHIQVNATNLESGWTPLHMALYEGQLLMALTLLTKRPDVDVLIRDKEGIRCLDLLNSTLEYGSLLNSFSYKRPVELPDSNTPDASVVESSDEESLPCDEPDYSYSTSVWTWGSNMGKSTSDTLVYPEALSLLPRHPPCMSMKQASVYQPTCHSIVMSKYHCGLVLNQDVYMHGFGVGGRLGLNHQDTVFQPHPVKDLWNVASIAVGTDHSVAVTHSGDVFTWGSNKHGQLGYPQESCQLVPKKVILKKVFILGATASKFHTAVYCSQGHMYTWGENMGQLGYKQAMHTIQSTPKKVVLLVQQEILQMACTNDATAVLVHTHDVYVFSCFTVQKVHFPLDSMTRTIKTRVDICKIVSGKNQFCALSTMGDVYMWVPPMDIQYADKWQMDAFPQKNPKKVWSVRKRFLAARDMAIGIDSSLLICTESGHVYQGTRRKEAKVAMNKDIVYFKFNKVPNLQHIVSVAASESGGYAALRQDQRPFLEAILPSQLAMDMKTCLMQQDSFDVYFVLGNDKIGAHRVVLAARCGLFYQAFAEQEELDRADMNVLVNVGPRIMAKKVMTARGAIVELHSDALCSTTCRLLLEYLYTGSVDKHVIQDVPKKSVSLLRQWGISDITSSVFESKEQGLEELSNAYHQIMTDVDYYHRFANVKIVLQQGHVVAHSYVLASRCPFFAAMMGSNRWTLKQDDQGLVLVDLSHISLDVFQVVLEYLYTDLDVFQDVKQPDLTSYFNFIVQVMACANELLLERLKEMGSAILTRLLDLTNITDILQVAYLYAADKLKKVCLDFVCWNIETMIESGLVVQLPFPILCDIESRIQEIQLVKFPFTRGPDGFYARMTLAAQKAQEERKEQKRRDIERRGSGIQVGGSQSSVKRESRNSACESRASASSIKRESRVSASSVKKESELSSSVPTIVIGNKVGTSVDRSGYSSSAGPVVGSMQGVKASSSSTPVVGSIQANRASWSSTPLVGSIQTNRASSNASPVIGSKRDISRDMSHLSLDATRSLTPQDSQHTYEEEFSPLLQGKEVDNIFELELEESAIPLDSCKPPKVKSKRKTSRSSWVKFDPSPQDASPSLTPCLSIDKSEPSTTSSTPKMWNMATDTTQKSLRDIMASEQQKQPIHQSPASIPTVLASSHPPPIKTPTKMSQKERRRISMQKHDSSADIPPKPSPAWSRVAVPDPSLDSEGKGILFQRQGVAYSAPAPPSGLSLSLASVPRSSPWQPISPGSFSPSPVLSPTMALSPPSFQLIQQQQQSERKTLQKILKKSLHQIQMEEQAVAALKEYYKQRMDTHSGEWFDVEIIPKEH